MGIEHHSNLRWNVELMVEDCLPPRVQPFPPLSSIKPDRAGGKEVFMEIYRELWGVIDGRNRDLVGHAYRDMDSMMGICTRALFKVVGLYTRCSHRQTGEVWNRDWSRGGSLCRACLESLGYLVEGGKSGGLVQGLKYSTAVDMVEAHLVEKVACIHALVKLLSPLHPKEFEEVSKNKGLVYSGQ